MGKFKLYILTGCCALVAAILILIAPKDWFNDSGTSMYSSSSTENPAPKDSPIEAQLQKIIKLPPILQQKAAKKKKVVLTPPSSPDTGQVQEVPPTNFNEIMVKTALSFAYKVGSCNRNTCPKIIDPSTEQWRIYAKVVTESKNACIKRQLNACIIHGDILVAEKRYIDALNVAKSGLESARGLQSRCENKDPNSLVCVDAKEKSKMFSDRIKDLGKALMQAH